MNDPTTVTGWSVVQRACFTLALAIGPFSGCTPDGTTEPNMVLDDVDVTEAITGRALEAFAATNGFTSRFVTRPTESVSESKAIALAEAHLSRFGSTVEPTIDLMAGRDVDLTSLTRLPGVVFAETPYEELSPNSPVHVRAHLGPAYLVIFADDEGPAVIVSVSTSTTDYDVLEGELIRPAARGNQFRIVGVPAAGPGSIVTAEEAVLQVANLTGAMVDEPPIYLWLGSTFGKSVGAWRLPLDREVSVRTTDGHSFETRTVFLDRLGDLRAVIPGTPTRSASLSLGQGVGYSLVTRPEFRGQPVLVTIY